MDKRTHGEVIEGLVRDLAKRPDELIRFMRDAHAATPDTLHDVMAGTSATVLAAYVGIMMLNDNSLESGLMASLFMIEARKRVAADRAVAANGRLS